MATLEILHWNDVHGRFEGLARLAARVRQIRAESRHPALVLDGGDVEEASVRLSALTFGVAGWRLLCAAGVDAAVAGNGGLLRYGPGRLAEYAAALGAPPLVCDLETAEGHTPTGAAGSVLLERGGLRVGVVGVTDYYPPYDMFGLRERGRVTAVRREAAALRQRDADVVVLLSHAGHEADRALSWHLRGVVDLIVGGHTHHLLEDGDRDSGVPIAQAGCYATHLGRVLLEVDEGAARVVSMRVEGVPEDAPRDPAVLAETASCERDLESWLDEPVGSLDQPAGLAGTGSSPVALLMTEALLHHAPADVGVLIAAHMTGGLPAGKITRRDVWAATSSPGNLATATLSGTELRGLLHRGVSAEFAGTVARTFRGRAYGTLQVVGAQVHGEEVVVAGEPLDDARDYRVTSSDLELSTYGTLLARDPEDRVVQVPAILPEVLEAYLAR